MKRLTYEQLFRVAYGPYVPSASTKALLAQIADADVRAREQYQSYRDSVIAEWRAQQKTPGST